MLARGGRAGISLVPEGSLCERGGGGTEGEGGRMGAETEGWTERGCSGTESGVAVVSHDFRDFSIELSRCSRAYKRDTMSCKGVVRNCCARFWTRMKAEIAKIGVRITTIAARTIRGSMGSRGLREAGIRTQLEGLNNLGNRRRAANSLPESVRGQEGAEKGGVNDTP
jgi:hypothetical protein